MTFQKNLSVAVLLSLLSTPSAFAKIYPDDFMLPESMIEEESSSSVSSPSEEDDALTSPFFFASEIPEGRMTRAEFIDAIATRLYDADAHDTCFGDLVASETVDYNLLFNDVSLDATYASSVCVLMRSGLARGMQDGNFRPDQTLTAADAAGVLARLTSEIRPMKGNEAWYVRYMEVMRSLDREFTMRPADAFTGAELKHSLCVLKDRVPELDPLEEFTGC